MKLKKGFVLREVAGQGVVIATGDASMVFHGMIKLNATGELIWKAVEQGGTETEIVDELVSRFHVPEPQAKADVADFVQQMRDNGFLAD